MLQKYYCKDCQKYFSASGQKVKSSHPLYGPIWNYQASCPNCHQSCPQYHPKPAITKKSAPSCPTGTCPFAN